MCPYYCRLTAAGVLPIAPDELSSRAKRGICFSGVERRSRFLASLGMITIWDARGAAEAVPFQSSIRPSTLINRNLPQQLEVVQHLSGAQHHAAQRIVSDRHRQSRFFADALVQVLQQCATAG